MMQSGIGLVKLATKEWSFIISKSRHKRVNWLHFRHYSSDHFNFKFAFVRAIDKSIIRRPCESTVPIDMKIAQEEHRKEKIADATMRRIIDKLQKANPLIADYRGEIEEELAG